jgi:serine/threonine protein kinase
MRDSEEKNNIQPGEDKAIPTASFAGAGAGPGGQVGPYKLLSILGEGGYGIVYLAEQQKPVRRRVALKVIKPGMDTKEVIARFEAERQALALLTHPNIAQVYTAETTEAGRPYFVMEYVKGVPIIEYCDTEKLTVEQRLKLFMQVCEGVQHAHQKGIIHRDIKPSNILVSIEADRAMPKIIDFGVAKALSQPLTDRTLYTEQGQFIGTPEYMSPEQAEMTHQDIDTRSDIYSLGVVLYELLTGVLPFDAKMLREGGVDHIRQVIREEEPKTPSTRLSTLSGEDLTKVSKHRHVDLGSLQRKLRGDLDWITLKTLEKDRTRRYGSVSEFTADISRHLNNEPILARPPSTVYKIKKFVRRNRVKVIAAAAVAAVLVVGLIISTTMYLQKKHALDTLAKLETAVEADRNLSTVQKLYAEGRYQAALSEIETYLQRKDAVPKARLLRAHLLFELDRFDESATKLKELLSEQPEIAGAAHYLLAKIYMGSDPNKAKEHQQLGESLLPQTAEAYSLRGMTTSTPDQTIQWLSRAVELDPSHYPSRKARALAYYTLKDYRKMAEDVEAIIVMRPKDSLGYSLRAIARREIGRFGDAVNDHNRAIEICDVKSQLAELYNQRRETYERMGDYKAALQDAQCCIKLEPNVPVYRFNVFTTLVSLGQYDAAREEYKKIVADKPSLEQLFNTGLVRHVFDVLGSGRPFEPPAGITQGPPFSIMQEAADSYRRLQKKAVRLVPVPSVYGQSSWSPDGKQLAYGRTDMYALQPDTSRTGAPVIYGASGIEILDIDSGKTRLLVSSGKDPAWSPDGKYIAFVRQPKRGGGESTEETWIIPVTGGEPRRLAVGHWPIWARDSKRLFFHSYADSALYSVSIDDPAAKPERIIDCPGDFPWVSPDEKYIAYGVVNELQIMEIPSGQVVTKWVAPGPEEGLFVKWSPDGKEIFLVGFGDSDLGLWSFDVQRKDAWQIFDSPAISCSLSPDRSRMAVDLRMPFGETWLAKLDPNIPTYQALAPVLTRDEFLTHRYEQYIRSSKTGALESGSLIYAGRFIQMLATLGTNQYREANYEDAIVSLTRADELRRALSNESDPCDVAHIAMALYHLGRQQEAQAALNRLRLLFEDDKYALQLSCLCEAEMVFAGKDTKVYLVWECLKTANLQRASQLIDELKSLPSQDTQIAECVKSATKTLALAYSNRGKNGRSQGGGYSEMIVDYQTAVSIDPYCAPAYNALGWLFATCPYPEFRDGAKAIKAATKACELTNWKNHKYISTLAAAYSEGGDFTAAIKWQKEAIDLLPQDKRATWKRNYDVPLKLYQSGKAYHTLFSEGQLVAQWKFDEVKGSNVIDSSGNGLHGKLIGDAKIISDPERGNVLSLDGDGDYVDCGNKPAFDIIGSITITAWIKVNAFNKDWQAIVTKGDSAWRLSSIQNETRIHFAVTNGPPGCYVNGNTLIPTNEWHHVCGTYDGTKIRLYTDGIEDSASPVVYTGGITTNNYPVYIGENAEWTGRCCWNGLIDDVRIYNYALSEAEVKNLYTGREPVKK